jgi:hypothetical protein
MSAALQTGKLNEGAVAFLNGGNPRPAAETSRAVAATAQPAVAAEKGSQARPELRVRQVEEFAAEPEAGLVALTVRVARTVPPGLLLASVDRKLKRLRPWTQQEIVTEAIHLWLKNHGYLS